MDIMAIRSNFNTLRARLETLRGEKFPYRKVAQLADVSQATLVRFATNRVSSVRYDTLEKLVDFFQQRGIECEPGDLLVRVPDRPAE